MNRLVRGLSALTIAYLLILSMFATCLMQSGADGESCNAFLGDRWYLHVVVIAVLVVLLRRLHGTMAAWSCEGENDGEQRGRRLVWRVTWIVAGIYLVCGLAFILSTQLAPSSDGAKVMEVAEQILAGNREAFEQTGYMYRYPFQRGLVLLDLASIRVFGNAGYLALQVLNLIALITILICMVWLVDHVWQSTAVSILTALLQLLFIPMGLYITHNYGILYGMALSFVAICLAYQAWTTRQYGCYVGAAIAMALAIELKSNSLIWLIGLSMAILFSGIRVWQSERRRAVIGVAAIVGMFLVVQLASACSGALTEHLAGVTLSQGMPKTCWIYMGLQDDDDKPGAYNGNSVSLYEEYDYDYDATNEEAVHRIVQLFGYMASVPGKTVNQFYRKIAFEWNNPTFESLDIQSGRLSGVTGEEENPVVEALTLGGLSNALVQYMNLYQTVILAFALVAMVVLWRRHDVTWWEIVLFTILLGGFAFHLFWEAKPQYTLPYFLLLIPYAAKGMFYVSKH